MEPHEILGIPLGAATDVVRAAYLRAALESHPDKGGTNEAFQRVGWAFEQLSGLRGPKIQARREAGHSGTTSSSAAAAASAGGDKGSSSSTNNKAGAKRSPPASAAGAAEQGQKRQKWMWRGRRHDHHDAAHQGQGKSGQEEGQAEADPEAPPRSEPRPSSAAAGNQDWIRRRRSQSMRFTEKLRQLLQALAPDERLQVLKQQLSQWQREELQEWMVERKKASMPEKAPLPSPPPQPNHAGDAASNAATHRKRASDDKARARSGRTRRTISATMQSGIFARAKSRRYYAKTAAHRVAISGCSRAELADAVADHIVS